MQLCQSLIIKVSTKVIQSNPVTINSLLGLFNILVDTNYKHLSSSVTRTKLVEAVRNVGAAGHVEKNLNIDMLAHAKPP